MAWGEGWNRGRRNGACVRARTGGGCSLAVGSQHRLFTESPEDLTSFDLSPPTRTGRGVVRSTDSASRESQPLQLHQTRGLSSVSQMGSPETVDYPSKTAENAAMRPTQTPEFLLKSSTTNLVSLFLCLPPTNKFLLSFQVEFSKKKSDRFSSPSQDKLLHTSLPADKLTCLSGDYKLVPLVSIPKQQSTVSRAFCPEGEVGHSRHSN